MTIFLVLLKPLLNFSGHPVISASPSSVLEFNSLQSNQWMNPIVIKDREQPHVAHLLVYVGSGESIDQTINLSQTHLLASIPITLIRRLLTVI